MQIVYAPAFSGGEGQEFSSDFSKEFCDTKILKGH